MADKIMQLLQHLQDDVSFLRGEVRELSGKIDNLSSEPVVKNVDMNQNQQQKELNYENTLPEKEQEDIKKISQDNSEEVKNIQNDQPGEVAIDIPDVVSEKPLVAQPDEALSPRVHKKSIIEKFFIWLAKDWPIKIGGFFVIASVGWFVAYAATVGWLSPSARVVLGYVFAISSIVFGSMRANKERIQGNVFLIIGIGAMLASTLAGIYFGIITHVIGLFVMLISVAFVTLVSLKQKNISLTSSMIFFGSIIPLFFFSGIGINTIFVYLFILTLGTLWVVAFTKWRGLTTMMLAVVAFYAITYIATAGNKDIESLFNILVAFLFIGVFYVANVSSIIFSKEIKTPDLITALGIGTLFLTLILSFTPKTMEVFILLIGVLLFAIASYLIFIKTARKEPTIIYSGVSAVLLVVATNLLFNGPILVIAFLMEASVAIIIVLYIMRRQIPQGLRLLLTILYSIPVFMSLGAVFKLINIISYSQSKLIMDTVPDINVMPSLFVVLVVCITAFAVAMSILKLTNIDEKENMSFFRIFAYLGGIYGLMLVWLVTHLFMSSYDVATFISLVIYTIIGVVFYVMGVREGYKPYMIVGGILFGVVAIRVLFVEFWEMGMVMRIITSFVLGSLLISTAFIKPNKK